MAFVNRIGNMLKQAGSKCVNLGLPASNSSLYQAVRCMSSAKLFVGGLSYGTDEMSLREAFAQYGEVIEARIIMDRETGRSRGFGFVSYTSTEEASSAMQALDGQDLHGRRIRVNYATERPRGGGFGGGYGSGGGFYSGGGGGGNSYGGGEGYGGGGYGNNPNSYANGDGNYSGAGGYGGGSYGTAADGNYNGGMSTFNDGSNATYGGGSNTGNYNPAGDGTNYFSSNSGGSGGFTDTGYGGSSGTSYDGGEQSSSQDNGTSGRNEDFGSEIMEGNNKDDKDEPHDYANTRS